MDFGLIGLILLMLGLGIFIGSRPSIRTAPLPWLGKAQMVLLFLLIFVLGVNIGSDPEIVASLGELGLSALLVTLLAMAGSVVAVFLVRRLLGLTAKGQKKGEEK